MLGKHRGDPNFDPSARSQTGARNGQTVRGYYPGLGIVVVNSGPTQQSKGDGGSGNVVRKDARPSAILDHDDADDATGEVAHKGTPGRRGRDDEDGDPRELRVPTRSTRGFGKATVEADR